MIEVNKIAIPFAKSGNKSVIYDTRQQGQAENEATWSTGFPPVTMIRKEDGGLPPTGLDFNGIFYDISSNIVFACMGGRYKFDAEYAEKIGGYPKGAILLNDKENMQYISNTDDNKTNFNTADASKLTDWSIISIADIDKLLAKKIDNADFSEALNKKANTSTNVNAGNGLTGGGDLTTSRTLTLGTPSTISQDTKNSVTQSSHTHEIAKATTAQQGIVQLTNIIDASQDKAITPFAVNELQKLLQEALRQAIPIGFIANWPGETAPNEDWLIMRGQKYDRAKYSELYDLLKTDTLPDGRGVMLRGLDANRGFDPGRALLSYQEDAMQKIYGEMHRIVTNPTNSIGDFRGAFRGSNVGAETDIKNITSGVGTWLVSFDSSLVARSNTQNETVSKNLSINIIIKVK